MTTTLNAATSAGGGLIQSADASGILQLQTAGTAALTIDGSQNVQVGMTTGSRKLSLQGILGAYHSSGTNDSQFLLYNNGSVSALSATYGSTGVYTPIVFYTSDTERMRINAGAPILCLSGGNTSATGTGIAFPATQSASSDANTLDDYEEGTFTPVLTADGGSGWTYSTQVGAYTKIGNVVHVAYVLGLTAKGTMSGSFYLSGLPFTVENIYSSAEPWGISFALVNGLSTSVVSLTGWANNASTLMQVRKQTAAATGYGNSYLDVVDIGSTFYIQCSCTYRT